MTLQGKLETDVEISVPPHKFHDIFGIRTHHISNIHPDKIHSVDMHEGEWGKEGSKICWKYVHDGKVCIAKEIIEALDHKNNSITFRVIEGDLMEIYKSFVITIKANPKGGGSVIHWTMEYERLHDGVNHPETLLELAIEVTKSIETHILEEEAKQKGHDTKNIEAHKMGVTSTK